LSSVEDANSLVSFLFAETFGKVNNISKESNFGNVVRNTHVVGASAFMFLIIIHVIRNVDSRAFNRVSIRM